jgi:LEA14-like dessication related protein
MAAALCLAALSCASREPAPGPAKAAAIDFSFSRVEFQAIDLDSVHVSLDLRLTNAGGQAVVPASLDYAAIAGGSRLEGGRELDPAKLAPGESSTVTLSFDLDAPPGDSPLVSVLLEATLSFHCPDGITGSSTASVEGSFPRVMLPALVISSIQILKDELINTRLGVTLEVRNPNAFPLAFASLDYRLYGEGRYWASGSLSKPFIVPATGSSAASLYLTMNFTDMDRSLLDRVIRRSVVDYRLTGTGRIGTGLEFLPEFALPFDLSGRVGVD